MWWLFVRLAWSMPLEAALEDFLSAPELRGATVSWLVVDGRSGKTLAAHDADRLQLPASTQKLLTASAALAEVGPAWSFQTRLAASGRQEGEVLKGDLWLIGGGDPTLGDGDPRRPFQVLARGLAAAGVRSVEGRLGVDPTWSADPPLGAGWAWDDVTWRYSAPWAGLSLDHNRLRVSLVAEGDRLTLTSDLPPVCHPLEASAAPGPARYQPNPFGAGQILGTPGSSVEIPMVNPPLCAGAVLAEELAAAGVRLVGPVELGRAPDELTVLASLPSPTVEALLSPLLQDSDNLIAEALARASVGPGAGALEPTRARVEAWAGQDAARPVYRDGSGLSRYNLVSCRTLLRALTEGLEGPFGALLERSLAVAGQSGTLRERLKGTALDGRLRGKSGSMTGVLALVATLTDAQGQEVRAAMMMQGLTVPRAAAAALQDRWLLTVAASRRGKVAASDLPAAPPSR